MSRPVAFVLVAAAASVMAGTPALAQPLRQSIRQPVSVGAVEASVRSGVVLGVVRDDLGTGVSGVAVTAIGTTQAQARTDSNGMFRLPLVPGDYVLRATRDGYVSPYKEWVRIGGSARIERNITITKQVGLPERRVLLASVGLTGLDSVGRDLTKSTDLDESLRAWYLRHLPRTVLRDGSGSGAGEPADRPDDFRGGLSFLDWAVSGSAHATTSFFSETDFSGQVNFLTTNAVSSSQGWLPDQLPRGIAYLAVGAPVGVHGDWRLRGAMSTAGLASWVVLGEYEARDVQTHAFHVGMSYGTQRAVDDRGAAILKAAGDGRTAASVYGQDRWRVRPGFEIDYGLRLDRYDYVEGEDFMSPEFGVRIAVAPRTYVTGSALSAVVVPGVDEFLPPPSSGPWLPPERTFASLVSGAPFRSERVRRFDVGAEHEFGVIGQLKTVGVRWFHESSRDQLATMFGLGDGGAVGHYYVATPGSVTLDGWSLRASGHFTTRVQASMDYSVSRARWEFSDQADLIAAVVPSAVRPENERLHDLTSTLEASIPETSTRVSVAYRLNSAFARDEANEALPIFDGRFRVQLRQVLPIQPIRGGSIEFLVSVSNLFRDRQSTGSFYDELLAVRAPRRVLGGVQVRF